MIFFSLRTTRGMAVTGELLGRYRRSYWTTTLILFCTISLMIKGVTAAAASSSPDVPTRVWSSSSTTNTASSASASLTPQSTHSTMGSPESIKLRPRVISLNIMVAGLAGLGKTTTVRALLDAWTWQEIHGDDEHNEPKEKNTIGNYYAFRKPNTVPDRRGGFFSSLSSVVSSSLSSPSSAAASSTASRAQKVAPVAFGSTKAIEPSVPFEYFDPDANTILRVRIIDTPGFGNRVNHKNSVQPITDYITGCRSKRFCREQSPSATSITTWGTPSTAGVAATVADVEGDRPEEDELVHVCLYFLSPGRFLAIDRHFLKHVQDEVTIVPVIAKADTMTDSEISRYRAELDQIWKDESIDVYSLDDHFRPSSAGAKWRRANPENASARNHNRRKFHRGRRSGEVPAIVSRDGIYPWGHSSALDPEHSDLVLIRDSLLSEHTERFLQLANQKYSVYRNRRLTRQSRSDRFKYIALVALAAVQIGRVEIAGETLHAVASRFVSTVAQVPLVKSLLRALVARTQSVRHFSSGALSGMHDSTDGDDVTSKQPDGAGDEDVDEVHDQVQSKNNRGLIFGFFGAPSFDSLVGHQA